MCWFLGYFLLVVPRSWFRRLDSMMEEECAEDSVRNEVVSKSTMTSCMTRCEILFDATLRYAGPLYIVLAITLISGVIYLYFTAILPMNCSLLSLKGMAHTAIAIWLAGNVFFNYYYCIITDPGTPPAHLDLEIDSHSYSDRLGGQRAVRWCKRCHKPKPPMAHHCHVCRRCILKMDHHCPWMHNCIGFHNYRYFFLFLAYMWVGCLYAVLMSAIPLASAPEKDFAENRFALVFTFVLSVAVASALSVLFGWHVYLVATAQTTVDFYQNRQRIKDARKLGEVWENEFDLGWKKNFMNTFEVSGPWWWLWMWSPRKGPFMGDGVHFETRDDGYDCSNIVFKNFPEIGDGTLQQRQGAHFYEEAGSTSGEVVSATSTRTSVQSRERTTPDPARNGPDLV